MEAQLIAALAMVLLMPILFAGIDLALRVFRHIELKLIARRRLGLRLWT